MPNPTAPAPATTSTTSTAQPAPAGPPKDTRAKPNPKAPFPVGAKLTYLGIRRMFGGYTIAPLLEPGMQVTISEVAGTYSFYEVTAQQVPYTIAIPLAQAGEWRHENK